MIRVVRAGPLTTVQDLGRVGFAHLGVPRAGAADPGSLRRVNLLVGNAPDAAALEATLLGPDLRFASATTVALAGAGAPAAHLDDSAVQPEQPIEVAAGQTLRVGPLRPGLRLYVAVHGGIAVPQLLGSRATDTLAGLGPAAVRDGDTLAVGEPVTADRRSNRSEAAAPTDPTEGSTDPVLRIVLGPRDDWFPAAAMRTLTTAAYTVTPASDRVGVRLDGPALPRRGDDELPSEGMVAGALQVPPGGRPILFLANHPTTGGYPVIAVIATADLPIAAQARPGSRLRFRTVSLAAARTALGGDRMNG